MGQISACHCTGKQIHEKTHIAPMLLHYESTKVPQECGTYHEHQHQERSKLR